MIAFFDVRLNTWKITRFERQCENTRSDSRRWLIVSHLANDNKTRGAVRFAYAMARCYQTNNRTAVSFAFTKYFALQNISMYNVLYEITICQTFRSLYFKLISIYELLHTLCFNELVSTAITVIYICNITINYVRSKESRNGNFVIEILIDERKFIFVGLIRI